MFNILIVDDEAITRNFLKASINWSNLNLNLVAATHSADSALKIIKETKIHLVITDVVMPKISGIDLIKQAHEIDDSIKFIVLSGYDDFFYVQSAYRLGAIDYILKPSLSIDYLTTLILNNTTYTAPQIVQNTDIRHMFSNISPKTYREDFILKQNELSYLFMDNKDIPTVQHSNIILPSDGFNIMYVTLFTEKNSLLLEWGNDFLSFQLGISNIIEELIGTSSNGFLYSPDYLHYAIVLNKHISAESLFLELSSALRTYMGVNISGTLSNIGNVPHDIFTLYGKCQQMAPLYFYYGKNFLIQESHQISTVSVPLDIESKLYILDNFFETITTQDALEYIDHLTVYDSKYSISDLLKLFEQYAYAIEKYCKKNHLNNDNAPLFVEIKGNCDLIILNQWLKNYLFFISESKLNQYSLIENIKNYMEKHYKEDITLNDISAKYNISKWYFCHLFQQKTGMSFVKYLANIRVEKAKQFLLEGKHKIYWIASECGYSSTEHFSRYFKKITGMSPSQFCRENQINEN